MNWKDLMWKFFQQLPGASRYNLALYYVLRTPLKDTPLLESFVNGDDAFRNSRFKLIPYISQVGLPSTRSISFSQKTGIIVFEFR